MSVMSTEPNFSQLAGAITELARTRVHHLDPRQVGEPGKLTLKSAMAIYAYLSRQPERAVPPAAPDIAAQVTSATAAATAAVHNSSQRASAAERLSGEGDEGYYLRDGKMYKVATSQYGASQGHLFARKLNEQTGGWERAQGMTSYLRKSERITEDQAVEFGRQLEITPQMALYGRCWICKKVLTDEISIANRVGPGPHKYL